MIKILTAHSGQGGSTTAHMNLCGLFNRNGIPCEVYGPHDWHLDKCPGRKIEEYRSEPSDIVIVHLMKLLRRPRCHRLVYSAHEFPHIFALADANPSIYDGIHFVGEALRNRSAVAHPNERIIANVLDRLHPTAKTFQRIAGIIGSIEPPKQTHLSIDRALEEGMEIIHLYGGINDPQYFELEIAPRIALNPGRIQFHGYCEDKQAIYDSVTDIYHSSLYETWGYVSAECRLAGVNYHGNQATAGQMFATEEDILTAWKDLLEIP